MLEFFGALAEYEFLQNALLGGLLASVASGVVGSYVVVRRISVIAGAIAHSVLGGIGAARYLATVHGWTGVRPLHGAIVAALLSAFVIGIVGLRAKEREDTLIGAVWAIGMAVGVLFMSQTPGYGQDLMSYLFGNVLLVSRSDLWLMAALDAVVIGVAWLFRKQIVATCFDEEFARLRGVNTSVFYLLLLALTALTVVLLSTVVGIVLVIALLTIPAAIAGFSSPTLARMMMGAVLLSAGLSLLGLALSYQHDLPSGAVTIILAGVLYVATAVLRSLRNRSRRRHPHDSDGAAAPPVRLTS